MEALKLVKMANEIAKFFERLIRAGQTEGTIAAHLDVTETARMLLSMVLGIRVLARARPDRSVLEGLVRPALAMLAAPPSVRTSKPGKQKSAKRPAKRSER